MISKSRTVERVAQTRQVRGMIEEFKPEASEPLHEQVAAWLLRHVSTGQWAVHEKLPSEVVLAATLGVSRVTLRRAMKDLVRQGIFMQIHGRGTFVAAQAPINRDDKRPNSPCCSV